LRGRRPRRREGDDMAKNGEKGWYYIRMVFFWCMVFVGTAAILEQLIRYNPDEPTIAAHAVVLVIGFVGVFYTMREGKPGGDHE